MTSEQWGQVREGLKSELGEHNYINWIEPLEFADLDGQVARFVVPTSFMGTWVERNFGARILELIRDNGITVSRLEFVVANRDRTPAGRKPAEASGQGAPNAPAGAAPLPGSDLLQGAPLVPHYTFENFVVGKPNALAHAAARRVAEGAHVAFNPLFLYGGVGLGKTHLMHAIAHELRHHRPEARVIYMSAEQFMYRFVQALRERTMMDFKSVFRSVDVLMVDDIQFIAGKDSTQEEFFHTFNALVDQNKQIVLSADRAPGDIRELEERIRGRLHNGLVIDLHPADYELRLGILLNAIRQLSEDFPGVRIAPGVAEFLAQRITTSAREINGAARRLFADAQITGHEITLDYARACLADLLRIQERKLSIEEIQRKVAEFYAIRLSDMIGPKRQRVIVRPRQMAMYLAKQLTTRSLPEIGRRFGGRDHTTVMHAVRKIEELRRDDAQIAEDLDALRRQLEG